MYKTTLAEIVAKWERQLRVLEDTKKGFEADGHRLVVGTDEWVKNRQGYWRTETRIEMIQEHLREIREYALARAR
jgi:hypothetical protein